MFSAFVFGVFSVQLSIASQAEKQEDTVLRFLKRGN